MNGLLVIDKADGPTSHDVVARVRRILKTKRAGHTGTLDPFATGVLVILVGKATRLAQFIDKDEKEYLATVRFGFETDTGDRTGSRIADREIRDEEIAERIERTNWDEVLEEFRGDIEQIPPMYSAKKVEGRKLYELARSGSVVNREPVKVFIRELKQIDSSKAGALTDVQFQVVCSAGTYIRSLAEDIGHRLGLGAHVRELRRTRAGRFDLSKAITLEQLDALEVSASALLPMGEAVAHLAKIVLPPDRVARTRDGLSTKFVGTLMDGQAVRMIDGDGDLVAIGVYRKSEGIVQPRAVLR